MQPENITAKRKLKYNKNPTSFSFFLSHCPVDLNRLYDDVKRYSCTPRNYSVNLREELRATNAVFFPRCLLVKRCGGNCGCGTDNWNNGCTCQASKTTLKLHEVGLKTWRHSGGPVKVSLKLQFVTFFLSFFFLSVFRFLFTSFFLFFPSLFSFPFFCSYTVLIFLALLARIRDSTVQYEDQRHSCIKHTQTDTHILTTLICVSYK